MPSQMVPLDQMSKVALRNELTPATSKAVEAKGHKVLLITAGGDYFAVENRCSSCQSEMQDGKIASGLLTCQRCGSMYYYRTGAVRKSPATKALKAFELRYDSEAVYVGPEKKVGIKEGKTVSKETPIKW